MVEDKEEEQQGAVGVPASGVRKLRLHDASRRAREQTAAECGYLPPPDPEQGALAGDWRFCGDLCDDSGRGLTAQHSAARPDYVHGASGGALRLNGIDQMLLLPPSAHVVPGDGPFTIVATFRCLRPHCSDEGEQGGALAVLQAGDARLWAPRLGLGLRGDGSSVACWWSEVDTGRGPPFIHYHCPYYDGAWHTLAAVYDPARPRDGRVRLYYDGQCVAESMDPHLALRPSGTHSLLIGACKPRHAPPCHKSAAGADVGIAGAKVFSAVGAVTSRKPVLQVDEGFFAGDIDRVTIWARALDHAEVGALAAGAQEADGARFAETLLTRVAALEHLLGCRQDEALQLNFGLAGAWPLHGSCEDATGQGLHGCVVSEAFYTGGPNGGALACDGLTNFVYLPSSARLVPGRSSTTLACFFKTRPPGLGADVDVERSPLSAPPPSSTAFPRSALVALRCGHLCPENSGSQAPKLLLQITEGGTLGVFYRTGAETCGEVNSMSAVGRAADGLWHHAACVYDCTSLTLALYLDGAQIAVEHVGHLVECGPAPALVAAATESKAGGAPCLFAGEIAEVRVYSTALPAPRVAVLAALRQDTSARGPGGRHCAQPWTVRAPAKAFLRVDDRLNPDHDAPAPVRSRVAALAQENGWLLDRLSLAEGVIRQLTHTVDTLTVKVERLGGNPLRDRALLYFNGHSSFWGLPRGVVDLNQAMDIRGDFTIEGWVCPERGGGTIFDRPQAVEGGFGLKAVDYSATEDDPDVDVRDVTWLRVGLGVPCCTKDTRLSVWHPRAPRALTQRRLPLLRWTHFAAVWSTEQNNTLILYLDGKEDSRHAAWPPPQRREIDGPVFVGRDALRRFYKGRLRDVRLWTRPLGAAQLQLSMDAAKTADLCDKAGLLAEWPCDADAQGARFLNLPRLACHWYP